jgi:GT2 family glycosyltransferase
MTDELQIKLLSQVHTGPAAARNLGAGRASGRYLAFTDDDCRVTPSWLSSLHEGFAEGTWQALGGRTINPYPNNLANITSHYFFDFLFDYLRVPNGDAYLIISNNAAYEIEAYRALGGFNSAFRTAAAEDRELSHRMISAGYRQTYWPEAQVWHDHPLTWRSYMELQFRYGRGGRVFRRELRRAGLSRRIGQRRRPMLHWVLAKRMWRDRLPARMWLMAALMQLSYFSGSRMPGG